MRILLADDHQVTRLGLRTLLAGTDRFQVVAETGTVAETIAALQTHRPDLLLLELRLPDGSGLEICRHAQQAALATRVLVLTSCADDQSVLEALASGAGGYLLKTIDGAGLLHAVEAVAGGRLVLDPGVTSRVVRRLKGEAGLTRAPGPLDQLSPQQQRVVALVAEGKTNKEIGLVMGLSDKTVKNYLSSALDKLKLSRRAQAAALFASASRPQANYAA